jgi:hypothetical protein
MTRDGLGSSGVNLSTTPVDLRSPCLIGSWLGFTVEAADQLER